MIASKSETLYFIYGPPGSGKSTLARRLAGLLDLPFMDLDEQIQASAGMPIPAIFDREGERGFRQRERAALEAAVQSGRGVVALGGGALLDPTSRSLVESAGRVLCLRAERETLFERLGQEVGTRPLLGEDAGWRERLDALLAVRAAHYHSFPLSLDTSALNPEEAARQAQLKFGAWRVSGMGTAYDVRVVQDGLDALGSMLRARGLEGPLALVSDSQVAPLYAERVEAALKAAGYAVQRVVIPAGEEHKTLETVSHLWEAFLAARLDRRSTVLALGGGVVGDLAGFAAAVYLRGVRWVALPTTLLAMADASLGGKTGADLPQGKNLIGAFHPPALVLSDPATLSTLPEAELRSGMAEVVKHGLLADPALFARAEGGWEAMRANLDETVRRAMAVKIAFIQADPYEKNIRAALNLGHTVGHAVEVASGYRLRHGEAVAIGLRVEARLAEALGVAEAGLSGRIEACLRGLGLPTRIPEEIDREGFLRALRVDKKNAAGQVRFALPERVGAYRVGVTVEMDFSELLTI